MTGLGVAAGSGVGSGALLAALQEGRSAIRPLDGRLGSLPPGRGARLDLPQKEFGQHFDTKVLRLATMTRQTTLGCIAAGDALRAAGLSPDGTTHPRRGAYLGSFIVPPDFTKQAKAARILSHRPEGEGVGWVLDDARLGEAMKMASAFDFLRALPNMPSSHLSIQAGYQGPACTYLGSDASGLQAIGLAARAIEDGYADVMLGGGAFFPFQEVHLAWQCGRGLWAECGATVTPFAQRRTGSLPGEGAALFVLEERSHAEARGATILAEFVGFAQRYATPGETEECDVVADALSVAAAGTTPGIVAPSALGHPRIDALEARAYDLAFGSALETCASWPVTPTLGFCGPASGPLQLAGAIVAQGAGHRGEGCERPDAQCEALAATMGRGPAAPGAVLIASTSSLDGVHAAVALRLPS